MPSCRVDLLPLEESKKAAESVEMITSFSELNIFRALLHRPKTAKALSDLLVSLLFAGELDNRLRELLIMRIGWVTGSDYEWTQHWAIAQNQFGCSEADLLAVRRFPDGDHFGDAERTILEATDRLLEHGDLDDDLWSRCQTLYGRDACIELVTAVGCWRSVSKLTRALRIPLEEGIASWPPDGSGPEKGA